MNNYRIVKRKTEIPKWKVVITCQGQPFDYFYKTVVGACIGLIKNYLLKKKIRNNDFCHQTSAVKGLE